MGSLIQIMRERLVSKTIRYYFAAMKNIAVAWRR